MNTYTTPRMSVHIKQQTLVALVTITNSCGQRLVTTMERGVKRDDIRIQNLKRSFAHVPAIRPPHI